MKSAAITKQNRQALPPGSRLWTPNNLKHVISWLSPRRLLRLGIGSGLSVWRDAKQNSQFVQSTVSRRPTLTSTAGQFKGLRVPEFDGTSDFLADESPSDLFDIDAGDFFVMAAIRTGDDVSGTQTIINVQRESASEQIWLRTLFGKTDTRLQISFGGFAGSFCSGTTAITTNTTYLVYGERIGNGVDVYLNGVKDNAASIASTVVINNSSPAVIGARNTSATNAFKGKIAEVVMGGFNSASQSPIITTKTRQLLEGYMAHNSGIADVLPSDHPYRKGPPRR